MEALIEFLFGNIVFVFLILSGLFSFFKRANEDKNKQDAPKRTQPRRPIQGQFEQEIEVDLQEKEVVIDPGLETIDVEKNPYLEKMKQYDIQINAEKEQGEQLESSYKRPYRKPYKQKQTEEKLAVRASKRGVVEGIIWSEVLGPPRSKKPYQTQYSKKNVRS